MDCRIIVDIILLVSVICKTKTVYMADNPTANKLQYYKSSGAVLHIVPPGPDPI